MYDAISDCNQGYEEPVVFSQNSFHSNGNNSYSFRNISQNQFGRFMNVDSPLDRGGNDMNDLSLNTENYFSL